jgi:hypothetical protein
MRRRIATMLLSAVLLTVGAPALGFLGSASAASAPSKASNKSVHVTPPSVLDVQFWPEDSPGSTTLIVVAALPTGTPLPAEVTMPLPAGAHLAWIGELGVAGGQDIQHEPTLSPDKKTVTVTVQKSRLAQYEAAYAPYQDRGGRRYATLRWDQSSPAGVTRFAVKLPPVAADLRTVPAFAGVPQVSQQTGEKLYSLPNEKLAVGSTVTLAIDYNPGTTAASATRPAKQQPDTILTVVLVLLGITVVVLITVVLRSRPQE